MSRCLFDFFDALTVFNRKVVKNGVQERIIGLNFGNDGIILCDDFFDEKSFEPAQLNFDTESEEGVLGEVGAQGVTATSVPAINGTNGRQLTHISDQLGGGAQASEGLHRLPLSTKQLVGFL